VLDRLSLDIYKGEVLGFIGPSGSGKSVLMRTILGLNKKQSGEIEILGRNIDRLNEMEKMAIDMRMGVLFQHGALFSALNVLENIQVPMREYLDLSPKLMDELALDPDIVFLDEPTSGLDPIGAAEFDELIANLRDTMGLTVYMVTHDLDSLFAICDRIAVLGNKKVLVSGTIEDMLHVDDPWVKSYFRGKRARQIDTSAPSRRRPGSRLQTG
jgi:phospholipid/cholesterol/gamma-HCH transport system ATP-binding protein